MLVACQTMEQEEQQQNQGSDVKIQHGGPFLLGNVVLEILSRLSVKSCQTMEQEEQQQNQGSDVKIQHGGPFLLGNVVLEILSRLSVKSLLRFMCVCRHWKSLISSHSFRKLCRQRHNSSPPLLLAFRSSEDPETCEPDHLYDYFLTTFDLHGKVVQQCTLPISSKFLNIMHSPSQSKLLCFTDAKRFFSYNLSTRQFFCLPDPPSFSSSDIKLRTSDFGYIPSKDEYMMVHMVDKNPLDKWVCEVLTMSISNDNFHLHYDVWRSIEVTTMLGRVLKGSGVFVCGSFYWDARDENGNNFILSFDIETEVFSTFGVPQGTLSWNVNLLELKDELYLVNEPDMTITFDEPNPPPIINLWKLSSGVNNNKLWTLNWTINLESLGYRVAPEYNEFDWRILVLRLEYLQYYNKPPNILREMGMLKLEEEEDSIMVEEEEEYFMPNWYVTIHTNLFTL